MTLEEFKIRRDKFEKTDLSVGLGDFFSDSSADFRKNGPAKRGNTSGEPAGHRDDD